MIITMRKGQFDGQAGILTRYLDTNVVRLLKEKVFGREREELLSQQAKNKQGSRWQRKYGRPDLSCVWQCRLLGVAETSMAVNETILIQHPNKYSSLK